MSPRNTGYIIASLGPLIEDVLQAQNTSSMEWFEYAGETVPATHQLEEPLRRDNIAIALVVDAILKDLRPTNV